MGAVIPTISERRTRLQLDPAINPEVLMEKRKIKSDVTDVFRYTEEGEKNNKIVLSQKYCIKMLIEIGAEHNALHAVV